MTNPKINTVSGDEIEIVSHDTDGYVFVQDSKKWKWASSIKNLVGDKEYIVSELKRVGYTEKEIETHLGLLSG